MVVAKSRALQSQLNLPPGFRFTPTDEELLIHYLSKKAASEAFPVPIIGELDLYKFDPWDLPGMALLGEKEWYFFSTRSRKYPNGSRPNRVALSGYWKATGTDKPIYSCTSSRLKVGVKKALVFYQGRAPRGLKTNWIMHEYRLPDISNRGSFGEDDWVLCRIYERRSNSTPEMVKQAAGKREEEESLCFHRDDLAIPAMPCLDAEKESSRSSLDMGAGLERVPAIADFRQQQGVEEGELASSYFCSNSALPINAWGSDDFKSCLRLAGQPFPSNSFLMGLELEALPSQFPRLEPMTHSSYFAS